MIRLPRRVSRLAALVLLLPFALLAACQASPGATHTTLTLATMFPETGPDAAIGQAMERAVALAVRQHATLSKTETLAVTQLDGAQANPQAALAKLAANHSLVGIVGPLDDETAEAVLPTIEQQGIATVTPGVLLPGFTQADRAAADGLRFDQLHPKGKPVAFFRLPQTQQALGKAAADTAVAPTQTNGLGARAVFVVDDGTPSSKALASAFGQELQARQGTIAGQQSLTQATTRAADNAQAVVTAIIDANPDLVFFAGNASAGAELRKTLSLTGAPQLGILAAGPLAGDPAWSKEVGMAAAAASTTGISALPDLTTLPGAKSFITAYTAAYPGQALLPQSALAYDAAMDEISAIQALVKARKSVTRAAVRAAVATTKYAGVTGSITFDANGDNTTPPAFGLYACNASGAWRYVATLS